MLPEQEMVHGSYPRNPERPNSISPRAHIFLLPVSSECLVKWKRKMNLFLNKYIFVTRMGRTTSKSKCVPTYYDAAA